MHHHHTRESASASDAGQVCDDAARGRASPARLLLDRARRLSQRPRPNLPTIPAPAREPGAPRAFESVDRFLEALDAAIELLRVRELSRRELFKEVVQPLYVDLGPVVDDYYLLFARSIERVKAADAPELPKVLADIRALRPPMFLAREKVLLLADALRQPHQDRRHQQFCDRMLALFSCTRLSLGGGLSSSAEASVELLDQLEGLQSRSSKGVLVDALRVAKDQAALSWLRLNQTCTSLGLASLH